MKFRCSACSRSGRGNESPSGKTRPTAAFTMVEIALCLAIIGFALVAIIGVLPTGLNVQKDNREETIINQDAAVWMNAIRNGAQGLDDLTNYVGAITNYVWHYTWNSGNNAYVLDSQVALTGSSVTSPEINVFTRTNFFRNGTVVTSPNVFLLTNGVHIVGALSRPRIEWDPGGRGPYAGFYSNYIVANVRAISGSAVEKFPQTNVDVLSDAFAYRMIPERDSYVPMDTNGLQAPLYGGFDPFDPSLRDVTARGIDTNNVPPFPPDFTPMTSAQRRAYWDQVRANRRIYGVAVTNSCDLRLTFRWPLLPNGDAGNGRQTFRAFTGGRVVSTNDPTVGVVPLPLYFLQPSTYVQSDQNQ